MNQLAQLIDRTREANEWSDPDICRRAVAAGHHLSKSNLSRIRLEPIRTLVPAQVRALAAGLGLPIPEVLRAVLETLGLPAGDASHSPEQAIQNDPTLSAEAKRGLLATVRAMRTARPGPPVALSDERVTRMRGRLADQGYTPEQIDVAIDALGDDE